MNLAFLTCAKSCSQDEEECGDDGVDAAVDPAEKSNPTIEGQAGVCLQAVLIGVLYRYIVVRSSDERALLASRCPPPAHPCSAPPYFPPNPHLSAIPTTSHPSEVSYLETPGIFDIKWGGTCRLTAAHSLAPDAR